MIRRNDFWSAREDAVLSKMWRDGFLAKEINARLPNRTQAAILARAKFIDLPKRKARNWTPEEDAILEAARRSSTGKISVPGRTTKAVQKRIALLDAHPRRPGAVRASRGAVRLPSPDDIEARLAEIPEDTRDLTGRLMGDPLPGRSAQDRIDNGEAV